MPFPQTLASKQLKAWRDEKKLSQTVAAELLGVSQPTYSEYEGGRKVPRTAKAFEIQSKTDGAVQASAWTEGAPEEAEPKDVA